MRKFTIEALDKQLSLTARSRSQLIALAQLNLAENHHVVLKRD